MPNQGFGVQVFRGNGARIGGETNGGPCTGDCNVISGAINGKAQILLDLNATGALVRGNFIGTDVTGTARITQQHVPTASSTRAPATASAAQAVPRPAVRAQATVT